LIRTVFTYGSETWTLSKNSENALSIFERKILRRIYGPVQDNGQWRIRYNKELCELCGEPDLVTCIKLKRLQWAGHVQRMEGTRIAKEVFKAKFEGVRSVGKPRKRWEGAVRQDAASFLRCRNWKLAANDRTLLRPRPDLGCSTIGWIETDVRKIYYRMRIELTSVQGVRGGKPLPSVCTKNKQFFWTPENVSTARRKLCIRK
jgi:hypothetical protein